jgi:dihydrofolate synthase/folylpolyglutamate synthase
MAAIEEITPRRRETFGAFEAMFALACLYFQQSGCEFAVFEAGIGGRYDPVRLVGARVTCVTSVDYEHVELLGRTLDLIASDKSDACANGGTIIYGENCLGLLPHLLEYNRHRGVKSLFVRDHIEIAGEAASTTAQQFDLELADYQFFGLEMNLLGSFQFNNAAIAVCLFLLWLHSARPGSAAEGIDAAVRSGLREARWPGRLEMIRQNPLTVVDVGHTPDGIAQALRSLTAIYGAEDWILVLGISLDKPAAAIAGALAASFDTIVCTAAYHKGANAEAIADAVREANPEAVIHVASTVEQAVDLSQSLAASLRRRIFVAGGLFLAIEYSTVSRGGQARDLKFL